MAFERVQGLRYRLSTLTPSDGPVSTYESAREELHDAEVDYNYCLYFPSDEAFLPPPLSAAHEITPKKKRSKAEDYRLCLWSIVEQCMKVGTLQDLKDGKIRVDSPDHLDQSSAVHMEQNDSQGDIQVAAATDLKQIQALGQSTLKPMLLPLIHTATNATGLQILMKPLENSKRSQDWNQVVAIMKK